MVVVRGHNTNRASSFGKVGLSALQYDLPFKVRRAKLQTLSGQDFVKYGELAANVVFADWHRTFATAPSLQAEGSVGANLHEKLRRFDLDRYGSVEHGGFAQALKLAKIPLGASRVADLFCDLDVRGLGKVDIEMFCLLVDHWKKEQQLQLAAAQEKQHLLQLQVEQEQAARRQRSLSTSSSSSSSSSSSTSAAAWSLEQQQVIDEAMDEMVEGGDLFTALSLLVKRREDFLRCCLQLGGEEYASRSATAEATTTAAPSYPSSSSLITNNNSNSGGGCWLWCGALSGFEVWMAARHCGVPAVRALEREFMSFALKTASAAAATDGGGGGPMNANEQNDDEEDYEVGQYSGQRHKSARSSSSEDRTSSCHLIDPMRLLEVAAMATDLEHQDQQHRRSNGGFSALPHQDHQQQAQQQHLTSGSSSGGHTKQQPPTKKEAEEEAKDAMLGEQLLSLAAPRWQAACLHLQQAGGGGEGGAGHRSHEVLAAQTFGLQELAQALQKAGGTGGMGQGLRLAPFEVHALWRHVKRLHLQQQQRRQRGAGSNDDFEHHHHHLGLMRHDDASDPLSPLLFPEIDAIFQQHQQQQQHHQQHQQSLSFSPKTVVGGDIKGGSEWRMKAAGGGRAGKEEEWTRPGKNPGPSKSLSSSSSWGALGFTETEDDQLNGDDEEEEEGQSQRGGKSLGNSGSPRVPPPPPSTRPPPPSHLFGSSLISPPSPPPPPLAVPPLPPYRPMFDAPFATGDTFAADPEVEFEERKKDNTGSPSWAPHHHQQQQHQHQQQQQTQRWDPSHLPQHHHHESSSLQLAYPNAPPVVLRLRRLTAAAARQEGGRGDGNGSGGGNLLTNPSKQRAALDAAFPDLRPYQHHQRRPSSLGGGGGGGDASFFSSTLSRGELQKRMQGCGVVLGDTDADQLVYFATSEAIKRTDTMMLLAKQQQQQQQHHQGSAVGAWAAALTLRELLGLPVSPSSWEAAMQEHSQEQLKLNHVAASARNSSSGRNDNGDGDGWYENTKGHAAGRMVGGREAEWGDGSGVGGGGGASELPYRPHRRRSQPVPPPPPPPLPPPPLPSNSGFTPPYGLDYPGVSPYGGGGGYFQQQQQRLNGPTTSSAPAAVPHGGGGGSGGFLSLEERRACHVVTTRANKLINRCASVHDSDGSGVVGWSAFEESLRACCGDALDWTPAEVGVIRFALAQQRSEVKKDEDEGEEVGDYDQEVVAYPRMVFRLQSAINGEGQGGSGSGGGGSGGGAHSSGCCSQQGEHGAAGSGINHQANRSRNHFKSHAATMNGGVGGHGREETSMMPPPVRAVSPPRRAHPDRGQHRGCSDDGNASGGGGGDGGANKHDIVHGVPSVHFNNDDGDGESFDEATGGVDKLAVVGRRKGGIALAFSWGDDATNEDGGAGAAAGSGLESATTTTNGGSSGSKARSVGLNSSSQPKRLQQLWEERQKKRNSASAASVKCGDGRGRSNRDSSGSGVGVIAGVSSVDLSGTSGELNLRRLGGNNNSSSGSENQQHHPFSSSVHDNTFNAGPQDDDPPSFESLQQQHRQQQQQQQQDQDQQQRPQRHQPHLQESDAQAEEQAALIKTRHHSQRHQAHSHVLSSQGVASSLDFHSHDDNDDDDDRWRRRGATAVVSRSADHGFVPPPPPPAAAAAKPNHQVSTKANAQVKWGQRGSSELLGKSIDAAARAVAAAAAAVNHSKFKSGRSRGLSGGGFDGGGGGGGGCGRSGSGGVASGVVGMRSERRWRAKRSVALQTLTQRRPMLAALFRRKDVEEEDEQRRKQHDPEASEARPSSSSSSSKGISGQGRGCLGLSGLSALLRSPSLDLDLGPPESSRTRNSGGGGGGHSGVEGDGAERLALELLARVVESESPAGEERGREGGGRGDGDDHDSVYDATCDFNELVSAIGVEAGSAVQSDEGSGPLRGISSSGGNDDDDGGNGDDYGHRSSGNDNSNSKSVFPVDAGSDQKSGSRSSPHHSQEKNQRDMRNSSSSLPPSSPSPAAGSSSSLLDSSIRAKIQGSALDPTAASAGVRSMGVKVRHTFKRVSGGEGFTGSANGGSDGGGLSASCRVSDLPGVLAALGVTTSLTPSELGCVVSACSAVRSARSSTGSGGSGGVGGSSGRSEDQGLVFANDLVSYVWNQLRGL